MSTAEAISIRSDDDGKSTPTESRRLGRAGRTVAKQIGQLQAQIDREYGPTPSARAKLARLRRGLGKQPGEVPDLLELTLISGEDTYTSWSDDPTNEECAVHAALTLYALHQQSKNQPMHKTGEGFGKALRELQRRSGRSEAVQRRFEALMTAINFAEVVQHARGLIGQLRTPKQPVPFDYARFADDLVRLQRGGRYANQVRLAWGRDFHRGADSEEDTTADNDQKDDNSEETS